MAPNSSMAAFWLLILNLLPAVQSASANNATTTSSMVGSLSSQSSSTYSSASPSSLTSNSASQVTASPISGGSVPLFMPTDTAQSYRAAPLCTSLALEYYAAHNTSVPTNFAAIGDHTMIVPAGSTLTSIITGMDSYTNSLGSMTHPTFTFTLAGPTSTVFQDPAAYPTMDPFQNCCGYCRMPIFRPVIKYWPNTNKPPNTACLASCANTGIFGTTTTDNMTVSSTASVPSQYSLQSITFASPSSPASTSVSTTSSSISTSLDVSLPASTATSTQAKETSSSSSSDQSTSSSTSAKQAIESTTTSSSTKSDPPSTSTKSTTIEAQPQIATLPKSSSSASTTSTTSSSTYSPTPTLESMIPSQYAGIITARAEIPTYAPRPRAADDGSVVQYAVDPDDGFTYTSPYIYVMLKSVVANNQCNFVGGNYTNLRYSYLPGELSTLQFRYGTSAAFNFDDLPCPPDSVRYANGWNDDSCTYEPFLAPMTQILKLDPAFNNCWIPGCNLWDPPHTLTPQGVMTITAGDPVATSPPAAPQPVISQAVPTDNGPSMTSQLSMGDSPETSSSDYVPVPTSFNVPNSAIDPSATATPDQQTSEVNTPVTQQTQPQPQPTTQEPQPQQQSSPTPLAVGSQTMIFHSSEIIVGSQTLAPGSALTISGTPISLAPSATAVVVGSSTIAIAGAGPASPNAQPAATTFTISNVALTSSNGAIVAGSQTLSAGGAAITVNGQTISLAPTGSSGGQASLVIGSSTVALPTAAPTPLTITAPGGVPMTLMPSGSNLVLGSATLTPGGPALTTGGQTISLEAGGSSLVVGSSTIPLAKTTSVGIGGVVYTAWVGSSTTGGAVATATVGSNGTLIFTGSASRESMGMGWVMGGIMCVLTWALI